MTDHSGFVDFALVHGKTGPSLDCTWLSYENTGESGEVSFRTSSEYLEGLEHLATDYPETGWIDEPGHGFVLASEEDHEA